MSQSAAALVARLAERLLTRGEWLASAESCTGGLLAKLCTDLPGSSGWFERGLVTYSNQAKQDLLGVDAELIAREGAVSEVVVLAMARGLLSRAPVQHAVAISGVAGPGGGTVAKPVGTVWVAWANAASSTAQCLQLAGDRDAIRVAAAIAALEGLWRQT